MWGILCLPVESPRYPWFADGQAPRIVQPLFAYHKGLRIPRVALAPAQPMHLRKVGAVSVVKDQRFFSRSTCVSRSCLANRPGSREVLGLAAHKTPYSNRVSAITVLRFRGTRFCGQSQSSKTACVKPMSFSQKPQLINEPVFKEPVHCRTQSYVCIDPSASSFPSLADFSFCPASIATSRHACAIF